MKTTFGLFTDSKKAGDAVAQLKQQDFVDDVSLVAKKTDEENSHQVKEDVTEGTGAGAATGGVLGGALGLLAGLSSVVLPGVGAFLVAGPLTVIWGLTGGALGALTGGFVGALVDAGIPEERARTYEEALKRGDVLVAATTEEDSVDDVQKIFADHGARETVVTDEENT